MGWQFSDNICYDSRTGLVYLHTLTEDYVYSTRRPIIGSGGMGVVILGNSMRDRRVVAIKRVHDRYANIPEIRNRARMEACMRFRHENLVEMQGIVESVTGKGAVFIISNYINGLNIDSFVNQNFTNLPHINREKHIVTLMLPIINALIYIHHYNITHLDIKPSNIMVENGRNVRLMDLGISLPKNMIAQIINSNGDGHNGSTLMGTPKYAAPEQFGLPGLGEIGPKSDLYGYAVTLYELISGENPFESESLAEAIEKHRELVLPPSKFISEPVYEVLKKAAHPEQNRRYEGARELGAALNEAINPVPKKNWFNKLFS